MAWPKKTVHYFKPHEFACKCGCGLDGNDMNPEHILRLDRARRLAGVPFVVTSGVRCKKHNNAVGGVPDSEHTRGHGTDIRATTSRDRFLIMFGLFEAGFKRIGIDMDRGFIHAGTDPSLPGSVLFPY